MYHFGLINACLFLIANSAQCGMIVNSFRNDVMLSE